MTHAGYDPPVPSNTRSNLPNLLTLSRVALAAAFFAVLSLRTGLHAGSGPPDPWLIAAAVIFILAALTDALDGYLARRWGVVSTFGRIMDPFADKVLVLGAFVYLAGPGFGATLTIEPGTIDERTHHFQTSGVAVWMAVAVIARELLVTSIRAVFESRGIDFSAGWAGKAKMILQSLAIPLILLILALTEPTPGTLWRPLIDALVWLTVLVTLWSGVPYVKRAAAARPGSP